MTAILFGIIGLIFLIKGADYLVHAANRLALIIGIPPAVVGLTVVAFGTSAPEAAVTMMAAAAGRPGVALGNVVGSNFANIALILGVAGLIAPIVVDRKFVIRDIPVMIAFSVALLALGWDSHFDWIDGLGLFTALLAYTVYIVWKRDPRDCPQIPETDIPEGSARNVLWNSFLIIISLGSLIFGSRLVVDAAVELAAVIGISDAIIGLTVVAIGTSLPELMVSIVGARKGHADIAIGNIVGSNIFNIGFVLGFTLLVGPEGIPVPVEYLNFEIPVTVAAAIVLCPIVITRSRIDRWEAFLLLTWYVLVIVRSVMTAVDISTASYDWFLVGAAAASAALIGWSMMSAPCTALCGTTKE